MKYSPIFLLVVSGAFASVAPASAHSPQAVRYQLQDRGYTRIRFTDRYLPIYQVNACYRGRQFYMHIDYYGQVVRRERIGWCPGSRYDRRHLVDRRFRDVPLYRDGPRYPRRYLDDAPRYPRHYRSAH